MAIIPQYFCQSDDRRALVDAARDAGGAPPLNGIDFLEVTSADQQTLVLHFIHTFPGAPPNPVPPAPAADLALANVTIEGGVRIRDVRVTTVTRSADNQFTITVDKAGDFSLYTLRLVSAPDDPDPPPGFDPLLAAVTFSFKVECPTDLDCKAETLCPPTLTPSPDINYLAKDYSSFRQVMLDRMALLMPQWTERSPADLGIALVELLAYVGDYLSYRQDAVATEAYLDTARLRSSVRRHTRLVDYRLHDGCNARAWVQIQVSADVLKANPGDPPRLPAGIRLLTRIPGQNPAIAPGSPAYRQAVVAGAQVFETMAPLAELYQAHNEIQFYTWGSHDCCLPRGATRATLLGHLPHLSPGDVLIFKEKLGPLTGDEADADPVHRCAVRLIAALSLDRNHAPLTDPLTGQPITEIEWHAEDALPFALCVSSTTTTDAGNVAVTHQHQDVSVALGNVVLADHGRSLEPPERDDLGSVPPVTLFRIVAAAASARAGGMAATDGQNLPRIPVPPRYRPHLAQRPLTFAAPYPYHDEDSPLKSAAAAMRWDERQAMPRLTLQGTLDGITTDWTPRLDLLNSQPSSADVVVEVENDGTAFLRFGDGTHGMRPEPATHFTAQYRVGNGVAGNLGAEALQHIVSDVPGITAVSNPLPAGGGIEQESMEQARQSAPSAFRTQERAVTTADYEDVTQRHPGVLRAAASFRWTGSWRTVFVTVDRPGAVEVDAPFKSDLLQYLDLYRMAGYDLDIEGPVLIPLEIEVHVCVQPGYFRSEVRAALLEIFSDRLLPDGRRGIFFPDNFIFGQPVYLSTIYAAAQTVEGVQSVDVVTFQRQGNSATSALDTGVLTMGRLEIATLDNDPNFPDRGVFRLVVEGGK